jgi:hypothetical protein
LFLAAKSRGIAIPSDLETQVASLFNKAAMLSRQTSKWLQATKTPKMERSQSQVGSVVEAETLESSNTFMNGSPLKRIFNHFRYNIALVLVLQNRSFYKQISAVT